jgi:hypothetical protein
MANADNIFSLACLPGIQRDGTTLDSDNYIDGQWCRFSGTKGRPQKMGGYRKMFSHSGNVPRGTFIVPSSPIPHIYVGDSDSIKYYPTDKITGLVARNPDGTQVSVDRTPNLFNANQYNQWSFDLMFDVNSDSSIIIASAPRNLYAVEQEVEAPIYYGRTDSNDRLIETGFYASGGFLLLHPILFIFCNNGYVSYTQPNDPTVELNSARVCGTKIIAGRSTRGGQNSPAGLLWSLDSLIRVSNVGTSDIDFSFDTVSNSCTILSSNSIIQYNSIFYWVGTDNFYMYNGVVDIWPNSMSVECFFKNLNFSQRQKVWMTKNKRYSEIWIHYPSIGSNECDETLIYSPVYQVWYDSSISRSFGVYSQIFGSPIWMGNEPDVNNDYIVWQHEVGVDEVIDDVHSAIPSHFEMSVMSWATKGPGGQNTAMDKTLFLYSLEPDFLQEGDMQLFVNGRRFANSDEVSSAPYIFNADPDSENYKEKIDIREKRRLMTLQFSSNTIGGDYEMGNCLLVPREGDIKP